MKKAIVLGLCLCLQGCFMLPYNVSSNYQRQDESTEKRNTALNAVYAPPRLSISVEGESHTINIPEGILGEIERNSINIGENTEIDESTSEKSAFSKKVDMTTMLVILLLIMVLSGIGKKLFAVLMPQVQTLMHHYRRG